MSDSNDSNDDFFNRRKRKGISRSHQEREAERDNEDNTADSSSSSDLKLFGAPVQTVETIVITFCILGVVYLLYMSKLLFAGFALEEMLKSAVCIFGLLAVIVVVRIKSSILDIIATNVSTFRGKFKPKEDEDGKMVITKITTNDQIAFLMKFAMDIVKHWRVSYAIYAVIIAILCIIVSYIGVFLTILLLLIIAVIIVLKAPEISESFKKYLKSKTKEIPAKPPSVGVMTLFGNPFFDLILGPGIVFVYPGIIDFLPIEVHQEPEDFEKITGLFAKGDAEMGAKGTKDDAKGNIPITVNDLQVLYVPELLRLESFISAKEQAGVRDALKNMIASELRKILSRHSFDELIGGGKDGGRKVIETIEEELVEHLIGELFEGKKAKVAEARDKVAKARTEIDKDKAKKDLAEIEEEIAEAKKNMAQNGRSDVHLLGINIHRLSISSIETTDEYLKAMVAAAAEDKQRIGETKDSTTETMQAQIYFDAYKAAGEPKSWNHCLQMVMDNKSVREGHAVTPGKREFFESADMQKLAVTILKIVKEMKKQ